MLLFATTMLHKVEYNLIQKSNIDVAALSETGRDRVLQRQKRENGRIYVAKTKIVCWKLKTCFKAQNQRELKNSKWVEFSTPPDIPFVEQDSEFELTDKVNQGRI